MLFLAAAVVGGCAVNSAGKRSTAPDLLTVANGVDADAEKYDYAVQPLFAGGLPVPLDRLMLVVKRSAQQSGKNFSFTVTDETSLVDKFNIFAAEKITEDADYDPLKAREAFIIKNCGEKAAPHIAAYFRLLERRTLFVFSTTGLLSAKKPLAKDFYDREFFDTLQKFLSDAVTVSKDTPYAAVLEEEYAFFLKRRSGIELSMLNALPRFNAADANAGFQELTGILGDPVSNRSAVQCVLSPDKKFMILRMKADEPAMNKRRISGTGRDYPSAWRDDRFEIFISPDPEHPENGFQFVITSAEVLWDSRRDGLGYDNDLSWNSHARLKVVHHPASWEAELIIPLSDFGFTGVPEKDFLINIYRFREVKGAKLEKSAWSPIRHGSNFQPEYFGRITWGK